MVGHLTTALRARSDQRERFTSQAPRILASFDSKRPNVPFEPRVLPDKDGYRCNCEGCGEYDIDRWLTIGDGIKLSPEERVRLAGAIRRVTDAGGRLWIHDTFGDIIAAEHLPDAIEQTERLIRALAHASRFGTVVPPEHCETWVTRLYLPSWTAMRELLQQLSGMVTVVYTLHEPRSSARASAAANSRA